MDTLFLVFLSLLAQVVEALSTPAVADVESERRDSRLIGCFRFFPSYHLRAPSLQSLVKECQLTQLANLFTTIQYFAFP